ncbi:hypothetical protein ACIQNU_33080 [Streptomyces sp. NPDC091292]|uniref:hypothetical protein n=1 Tax=Streptomyces sp. NPDC091292 TaxID=3365991 RepID=UPI0038243A25
MSPRLRWHASTRRDEPPTVDHGTGEVRVPIALYSVDEYQGDSELVLSRTEGESLLGSLVAALRRRPEAVQ